MSQRVAVIGAGISGLAAALRLRALRPDLDLTVYERSGRAGGKILTDRVDGFLVEAGPDAFLASKRGGVTLSHELGLDERLVSPIPQNRRSFVLGRGGLAPLPQGFSGLVPGELRPIFQTRLLSPAGKARLAMDLVIPPRRGDGDESLAAFITRRLGRETYERMIEPLLSGIYAGDGARLSLAATFPQLRTSERTHGGILRGALAQQRESARHHDGQASPKGFLSYDEGMSVLVDTALENVIASGTHVELGAGCSGIIASATSGYRLTIERGGEVESVDVDGVVVAVPAWAAAPLLRGVVADASTALAAIEHVSSALVAVAFPASQLTRPLNGYGYVVPRVARRDVMAMTWISSKWANRAPKGQVLLRAFLGRAGREDILGGDDPDLVLVTLAELREVLGLRVEPTFTRVYRWDRGMPQYNMGHMARVQRIEAAIARTPGIEQAGNMLRGVGIPDSILSGEAAAANLLADVGESHPPVEPVARPPVAANP